jgi:ATP-binding cassette subfamily B protein
MKNILRIFKIAKPLYGTVSLLILLILFTSVISLLAPIFSKYIVDEIVAQIQTGEGDLDRLYLLIGITFALGVLSVLLTAISERVGDHFAGRIRQFLTERFYDKVLRLPQSYFDSETSGKINNQLTRGITTIQGFLNSFSNFVFPTFLQSIFTIVILAYYNVAIAFFVALLFPIYLAISYYSAARWGKEEVKKNRIEDINRSRIQEVISNIRLVKSFTNEKNEYDLVSKNLTEINTIYAKQSREFHIYDFFRNFSLSIILLGINIVAFYGTFKGNLSIGELVLILQLVNQARLPLMAMSFILEAVQMAEAGSKEYFEVLNLESKEDYDTDEKIERIIDPTIQFENVNFNYKDSENVLKDISFEISKNEVVALVGPSGAGKSTIINLILKFYEPTGGEIKLSEKNYKDLTPKFVRENVALVFQENELFSSTVKENVMYGQEATDEEIIQALKKANAWEFVQKLPNGINSEIGERGVKLSGGQKQRIQIARAILKDAPILILDEATSNLDAKSESEVQDALETLMEDRLTIIIAHRFSTIQNATKVVVIDENHQIENIGSPGELAKKPGIYSTLLHYQIEGNKKLLRKFDISL